MYPESAVDGEAVTYVAYSKTGVAEREGFAQDYRAPTSGGAQESSAIRVLNAVDGRGLATSVILGEVGTQTVADYEKDTPVPPVLTAVTRDWMEANLYDSSGWLLARCVNQLGGCNSSMIPSSASSDPLNEAFRYDVYGNLKKHVHGGVWLGSGASTQAGSQTHTYDALHLLTSTIRQGANNAATINYAYDEIGGLKTKTDYSADSPSAYQYVANTHRINSVSLANNSGTASFGYDANGNVTSKSNDNLSLQYDVSNLPRRMQKSSLTSDFYDAPGGRYWQRLQNGTATVRDTLHLDKMFEREIAQGVVKIERYYVAGQLMTISAAGRKLSYLHQDRLGSNVAISEKAILATGNIGNASPQIVEHRGFDAFGKALDGGWGTNNFGMLNLSGALWNTEKRNQRGFTGHEHLDEFALIHMNGRAYDYNLGRFYGVDPFIQFPSNSQSLNPYSYLMNNPLSGTDPTGYCSTGTMIKGTEAIGCATVSGFGTTQSNSGRVGDRLVTEKGAMRRTVNASGVIEYVDYKKSSKANGAPNNSSTQQASGDPTRIETASGTAAREKPYSVRVANAIGDFLTVAFEQGPEIGADILGLSDGIEAIKSGVDSAEALSEGDNAGALDSGAKAGGALLTALVLGKVDKIGDAFRALKGAIRGCCCFAAGTLIHTEFGPVSVELIAVGDLVWSRDEASGETALKPVTQLFFTAAKPIYQLTTIAPDGGRETVEVTDNHPYYVIGQGWVDSGKLQPGMRIENFVRGALVVESLVAKNINEVTYNFTVGDFHTYFVGGHRALVHNCTIKCSRLSASPALKNDPYHPDVVAARIRPEYRANPAHDPRSNNFNPLKTPEPADSASVYANAQRTGMGTWMGRGEKGWYQYFYDNAGGTHFSGIVPESKVPASMLRGQ